MAPLLGRARASALLRLLLLLLMLLRPSWTCCLCRMAWTHLV
jgi:hypothetical protein